MKRLQRVQRATAQSFVLGRFVSFEDILTKLKWLPVKEQREWNLLKATHKALHNPYCQVFETECISPRKMLKI